MQQKLNKHDDLLTNGENLLQGKNPTEWFSNHYSQESTNHEQSVTSIRNIITILDYPKIPTYSWTFNPISNGTWSCWDFFLCMDPNTCLTPSNWLIVIGCKILHFKACWRSESLLLQNPKVHKNAIPSHRVYEFSN